jgi:hypothetical protein
MGCTLLAKSDHNLQMKHRFFIIVIYFWLLKYWNQIKRSSDFFFLKENLPIETLQNKFIYEIFILNCQNFGSKRNNGFNFEVNKRKPQDAVRLA